MSGVSRSGRRRIDQVVHTFVAGDAVSDEALLFRDRLRERGFDSTIFAVNAESSVAAETAGFEVQSLHGADAILYHHATTAEAARKIAGIPGRKALLYHGVTPPEFFRPYRPAFADMLERGRADLSSVAAAFAVRAADSAFGAAEFTGLTGLSASVLPFAVDFRRFASRAARPGLDPATHGARWLSVGRIAPNKALHALVDAFAEYRKIDPMANLTLAGAYDASDPYQRSLRSAIDARGIRSNVEFTGSISDRALTDAYESSDVYVCLSEHEGFCVPLVEAMSFDLPIVAKAAAAIPETLGAGGILLDPSADAAFVASTVVAVIRDTRLRARVLAAQRARFADFSSERSEPVFDRFIAEVLGE